MHAQTVTKLLQVQRVLSKNNVWTSSSLDFSLRISLRKTQYFRFLQNKSIILEEGMSPDQTIAICQRNILQLLHCWAQNVACVWPPCYDMLRYVGCCWLKFDHFQTSATNTQHVATRRNRMAKRAQHIATNNVAKCCVGMLRPFGRGFTNSCFCCIPVDARWTSP